MIDKKTVKKWIGKINGTGVIRRRIEELNYARIFHDTLIRGGWFDADRVSFSLGRYAVGYNYFYVVYRILNEVQPSNLLEIGLGQSTLLIGAYMNKVEAKKRKEHIVVEHNEEWTEFFKNRHSLSSNSKIENVKLCEERNSFKNGYVPTHYKKKSFGKIIHDKKFDFISIDGPFGEDNRKAYNRIDILPYIPYCLSENFVIVIDDYERYGEQKMVRLLREKLRSNHVEYSEMTFCGENDVHVIASHGWKYLCSM